MLCVQTIRSRVDVNSHSDIEIADGVDLIGQSKLQHFCVLYYLL